MSLGHSLSISNELSLRRSQHKMSRGRLGENHTLQRDLTETYMVVVVGTGTAKGDATVLRKVTYYLSDDKALCKRCS
ncbi:hypothetical protein NDU88_001618 [Pleurodeles waltl]|uniref:Uncharacterized protein n=1 Tax=Pleurodeles waltl TaxID=8319 RepID=A0AAV7Q4D1_PLEWA|nr:hypothetical protein NDU88_001618 [Pleurodeles waltl]